MKLWIQTDWVIYPPEARCQVYHTSDEGATWSNHSCRVLEVANQGKQVSLDTRVSSLPSADELSCYSLTRPA